VLCAPVDVVLHTCPPTLERQHNLLWARAISLKRAYLFIIRWTCNSFQEGLHSVSIGKCFA